MMETKTKLKYLKSMRQHVEMATAFQDRLFAMVDQTVLIILTKTFSDLEPVIFILFIIRFWLFSSFKALNTKRGFIFKFCFLINFYFLQLKIQLFCKKKKDHRGKLNEKWNKCCLTFIINNLFWLFIIKQSLTILKNV